MSPVGKQQTLSDYIYSSRYQSLYRLIYSWITLGLVAGIGQVKGIVSRDGV
jgi:hypothetical protein